MSSLAELPELVGFFSYSREDDTDSNGALSMLRSRIQGELRGQLGRTAKTFRLWQDKEAIASGTLWESGIKNATSQSVFFIPIITPTVIASPYCKFELESFLAREAALGRDDLVFPILYIDVPSLEDPAERNDPILSLIAKRQYVDWRKLRHRDVRTTDVSEAVERFCTDIRNALRRSWVSLEERKRQEDQKAEDERQRREIEAKRRDEKTRQQAEEAKARERVENERHEREAEAEAKRREQETALQRKAESERLRKAAGAPPSQAEQVAEVRQAVGEVPNRRTRPPKLLLVAIGAVAIFVVGLALYPSFRPKPSPSASTATPASLQEYADLHVAGCIPFQTRFFGAGRRDVAFIGDRQDAVQTASLLAGNSRFSVVDKVIYPTGTTDLTPFISRVFGEKPAFVVYCGASLDLFKKQAGQLGLF
jgi:TIR domain-containing protein